MFRTFSSRAAHVIRRHSTRKNAVLLCVFLSLLGLSAGAAPLTEGDKLEGKNSFAQLRAYLPVIRRKALLDNERQYVADLERWYRIYERYQESGLVNQIQLNQVEEAILQGRIRILRRETDYRDSLDEYTHRFTVVVERRQQMEDAMISLLANLFRCYEKLSRDSEKVTYKLLQQSRVEDAQKLRAALVKNLTTSALVKDTALPTRFGKGWGEWEKLDSIEKALKKIRKIQEDRDELHQRETKLAAEGKELPQVDQQRLEETYFATCLGHLELELRDYEKQRWKDAQNGPERTMLQNESFRRIVRYSLAVIEHAYRERLAHLSRSWPALTAMRLKDVDLLSCDADKAEQTVTALLKTPDTQLAGKKKVQQLRTLAESYRIQQELFALAFLRREHIRDDQYLPKIPPNLPKAPPADPAGLVPPIPLIAPPTIDCTFRDFLTVRRPDRAGG